MATKKPVMKRNRGGSTLKTIKLIDEVTPELVQIMLKHARNVADAKLSASSAEFLLKHNANLQEGKDKTDMQKLLINFKLQASQGGGQQQQNMVPQINFNEIQEV